MPEAAAVTIPTFPASRMTLLPKRSVASRSKIRRRWSTCQSRRTVDDRRMDREFRDVLLTRRAVLGLMVAAAAGRARAEASAPIERPIPSSGEKLPAVGLGTWRTFDVGASASERDPLREVLKQMLALGGRVVDSSPMYGAAESVVGDLAGELAITDKLFLATKVWTSGREAGVAQMEQSLRRLRTRRLD